jgi:glutamyl-tRNA synthetase
MNPEPIVTRFPPSPTGFLHIGRARTALFNYLFTKKNAGKMVFRIEDTDKERSKKEYEQDIIECLKWLEISYDEGPYLQSQRHEIYTSHLKKLVDEGKAYISKEKVVEEGGRAEVIRFKNPNKRILFTDLIRGDIEFDTTELSDFVIAKSLNEPLYHLAVVIDDHLMNVTHVIRGEDGISNTPRQILIQEAIGAKRPLYAHVPLILAKDKSKLSGRHGAVSVTEYRNKGYLPQALVNYLALLGWNPGTDKEIFTMNELIESFDIKKIQKGGAVFDEEKLKWINKEHMKLLSKEEFLNKIRPVVMAKYNASEEMLKKIAPLVLERISIFSDLDEMMANGEFDYLFSKPSYDAQSLLWKGKGDIKALGERFTKIISLIEPISEASFNRETVKAAVWPYAEEIGRGDILWPMRYSLSGKEKSPDPFVLAELLGKKETIERLKAALSNVST